MAEKNMVDLLAQILVIVGGLNWGLVGIANMNLVTLLFGSIPLLVQLVYILVGLSALYMLFKMFGKK